MAEREIERWITVNGTHVPIYSGQSVDDAIKERQITQSKTEGEIKNLEEKYIHINPRFKKDASNLDKEGYNNNCAKCALAFEANMRGQDTEANAFKFGYSDEIEKSKNINQAFNIKNSDVWNVGSAKRDMVVREIELSMSEDWGVGSRAILQIESSGIRHVMNVINKNGDVIIVDAQNGTHGTVSKMLKGLPTKNVLFFRTDDRPINPEYSEWAYKRRG